MMRNRRETRPAGETHTKGKGVPHVRKTEKRGIGKGIEATHREGRGGQKNSRDRRRGIEKKVGRRNG